MRQLAVTARDPQAERACLMTAADGTRRKGDLNSLFAAVVSTTDLDDGQVLHLRGPVDELWPQVEQFVAEEQVCCPFFSFAARELPDGVELTITGASLAEVAATVRS